MKKLILLRHGKSDWDAGSGSDHDRPLAPRGRRAAHSVGRLLAAAGHVPDLVITSSAVRARTTAELAAEAGGWGCPIEVTRTLYQASPDGVLAEVRRRGGERGTLLLAGHEPTWSELAGRLAGDARLKVPTAALVRLDFAIESWAELVFGRGLLVWLVPPKLLEKGAAG